MTFHWVQTDEEARAVSRLAVEVFGPGTQLFVPRKPKWALYARNDEGEPAGGVILKDLGGGVGIVDWIFVHKRGRSRGLGQQLLEQGIAALDEAGCTTQFALIRDDNTPSWNMFATRGYMVPSILKVFSYSLKSAVYAFLLLFAMTGYSMWVRTPESATQAGAAAKPPAGSDTKPGAGNHSRVGQVGRGGFIISLLFTLLVTAIVGGLGTEALVWLLWATGFLTGVSLLRSLLTYPVSRLYGPVRFQLAHGGAIMSVLQAILGSWWPHFGFWAPKEGLWRISSFKRIEGIAALVGWFVTIGATFATMLVPIEPISQGLGTLMMIVLIFQTLPIPPFEGMDGFRVLQWSRVAWAVGLIGSIAAVVVTRVL